MRPSVPFVIARDGLLNCLLTEGMVSFDGANVKIEFRTADSFTGLFKSKVREVNIPLDVINLIELREERGWFGRGYFLFIRVAEMGRASGIPSFETGEILLSITDARGATELVSAVQVAGGLNRGGS